MYRPCVLNGILSLLALGLTTGCSALYVGHRDQARSQCERLPTIGERVTCRQSYTMTYEQYEKQRQTLQQAHPDKGPPDTHRIDLCHTQEPAGETQCRH